MYKYSVFVQIDPPALVRSCCTTQKNEIIRQVEVSAVLVNPMELIKESLIKGIVKMKEFNERIDKQYPNSAAYVR